MFDGGGVPTGQWDTVDPTHSFYIMYNTTLSVNISAHNCAGYSDPFPLDVKERLVSYP